MKKVILIGGGNVAYHLAKVFHKTKSISLLQVYNRSSESIKHLKAYAKITNSIKEIKTADVYIICVSDNAIESVQSKLHIKNALVVHTSGSSSINILKNHKRQGVFYPLQTFSKEREVSFNNIPLCIEANSNDDLRLLEELSNAISDSVHHINSTQRAQLHTAAVFVNNFVNHLYHQGTEICKNNDIDAEILHPLILETAQKIINMSPYEAQTGPARRGDQVTIKKHLTNLPPNQQEIYKLLSHFITQTYGKKL